jgi:hypothetical protein
MKTNKELLKLAVAEKKQMLKDCWEYHQKLIEVEGPEPTVKESDLEDFLCDLELKEWEDVGFFIGYLRALDWLIDLLDKK